MAPVGVVVQHLGLQLLQEYRIFLIMHPETVDRITEGMWDPCHFEFGPQAIEGAADLGSGMGVGDSRLQMGLAYEIFLASIVEKGEWQYPHQRSIPIVILAT